MDKQEVMVRSLIHAERYFETFGLSVEPLTEIQLVVCGLTSTEERIIIDMLKIRNMLNRQYGVLWNNTVLAKKGVHVDTPLCPVVYLDYTPSIENIAKAVFEDMAPLLERDFSLRLMQVIAVSNLGEAIYMESL